MRSLDVSAERLSRVLDVLAHASRVLSVSPDIVDSLAQIADSCVGNFADYCSIEVAIDLPDRNEVAVTAGERPAQPIDAACTIVAPLNAGRRHFGTITCETAAPDGFDATIRQAVGVLALQLAIVIGGHAAMLREHLVADRLQQALLPQELPESPGVRFYAAYRPASDEADVGGDWYDAFALADGRIAISVGDVAGHGLDAAVIMGEVRQAIRTAAVSVGTPGAVLEYVNGVIRLRESIGMVTAIFGIYDPVTSVLSYAAAGHPPPLLALSCGLVRRLPTGGLPLGCAANVETSDWTFTVPRGAYATFYTDGLIENERDIVAGEQRLLDVVQALSQQPCADPAAEVQARIFNGASNRDDAAVFVLSRTAPVPQYLFSAVPVVAPLARAIVEQELASCSLSEERRFGVLIAVGEAIANAVEHAYRGSVPGLIRLEFKSEPRQLVIRIEDFGRWRPFVRREERGRGIELMHAFMDGVQIRSKRESTSIVLKAQLLA